MPLLSEFFDFSLLLGDLLGSTIAEDVFFSTFALLLQGRIGCARYVFTGSRFSSEESLESEDALSLRLGLLELELLAASTEMRYSPTFERGRGTERIAPGVDIRDGSVAPNDGSSGKTVLTLIS